MLTHAFHLLNEICNVNSAFSESQKNTLHLHPLTSTIIVISDLNPVEIPSFREKQLPLPLYAINSPRLPIHPTSSDEINRGLGANNRRKFNPSSIPLRRKTSLANINSLPPLDSCHSRVRATIWETCKPNRNFDVDHGSRAGIKLGPIFRRRWKRNGADTNGENSRRE